MLLVHSDDEQATDHSAQQDEWERLRSKWLIRLAVLALSGLAIILLYGFQRSAAGRVIATAGLGLMTGGAAWLSGTLTGFLFGIPHAREAIPSRRTQREKDTNEDSSDEDADDVSTHTWPLRQSTPCPLNEWPRLLNHSARKIIPAESGFKVVPSVPRAFIASRMLWAAGPARRAAFCSRCQTPYLLGQSNEAGVIP